MQPLFTNGDTVLFQGDSITDVGRERENAAHLGYGYAMLAASWFSALYPEKNVTFLNRGVGGNRAVDLLERWQEDCITLRPTWVSLLIGINETWRRYDSNDPTSTEHYEIAYRALIERTISTVHARLILCEPFVLPVPADRERWREDLDPKIAVVRKLARKYHALYVPFDGIFAQAVTQRQPAFWAEDGVHPTPAGHALMAQEWLRTVKAL
ncbi:MAG TPA: SGNH/GDSL hydrolase family protein [Ktedonobacteraceae bacterium]|jgi:lysophospholipase L1-like esterase|nr:SGNH/GDSL hydrolase family protein [Ktedonobacteraceae bacterium]